MPSFECFLFSRISSHGSVIVFLCKRHFRDAAALDPPPRVVEDHCGCTILKAQLVHFTSSGRLTVAAGFTRRGAAAALQLEFAACTEQMQCHNMSGDQESYDRLGNFARDQQLYRLEECFLEGVARQQIVFDLRCAPPPVLCISLLPTLTHCPYPDTDDVVGYRMALVLKREGFSYRIASCCENVRKFKSLQVTQTLA
jgi:hypothetical protein